MYLITVFSLISLIFAKNIPSNPGRVCGFGDFNNDRNTDIIVQRGENLTVLLQEDKILTVIEEGTFRNSSTFHVGSGNVECSLGDFNGDSRLDVLVSKRTSKGYEHSVWFNKGSEYYEVQLDVLSGQAMAMDVDGDGFHDVFGFYSNGSMYCQKFTKDGTKYDKCDGLFTNYQPITPYEGIPHLYVDILGKDLLAEIVLMDNIGGYLQMQVWKRYKNGWQLASHQIPPLNSSSAFKNVGAPVPADFDADGIIELLVPICQDEKCHNVAEVYIWQNDRNSWIKHPIDIADLTIISDEGSKVLFRVGDFSMDGYPDLLVTVIEKVVPTPRVLENQACSNCEKNGTKKFEVKKQLFIQPKEIALGTITMTSFFDLKEDGSLDILVEYLNANKETMFGFIPCDYKGDTTFLKTQVFTSVCDKNCNNDSNELGSGISWGGSCMSFSMSDGWGGSLQSAACQLPAVTHRSLMAPFVLFGLGRSPNFVDELTIGVPRYSPRINGPSRQHVLKQIVPNSRLSIMPPNGEGTHWLNRLYVTPSQLILQSILVIVVVCSILLLVVVLLHYREKKEDRMERQQQSQRFHFDAM